MDDEWNLDQVLIWMATRNIEFVASSSDEAEPRGLWINIRLKADPKPEAGDSELRKRRKQTPPPATRTREGYLCLWMDPHEAEDLLLSELKRGSVIARDDIGDEAPVLPSRHFKKAEVIYDANLQTIIRMRAGSHEKSLIFSAAEIIERFSAELMADHDVEPAQSGAPPLLVCPDDIEKVYATRVAQFVAEGKRPTVGEDEAFFISLGHKRDTARSVRKKIAPPEWQKAGKHRSSQITR